jgi:hypothetical protein
MSDTPRGPGRRRNFRADRVAIETKRGKITFPSVRKAAVALRLPRTKLTTFLRRKHPRNAYYVGLTPPSRSGDDEWEDATDEERAIWNI